MDMTLQFNNPSSPINGELVSKIVTQYNTLVSTADGCDSLSLIQDGSIAVTKGWNLQDILCELHYYLETYYDSNHVNGLMKKESPSIWRSQIYAIKRFFYEYERYAINMEPRFRHFSEFERRFKEHL